MDVKVIETRVYKAYFDTGDFDPFSTENTTELPLFSCTVLATDVTEALAKVTAAFPDESVQSIHCATEGIGGAPRGRIQPEKVVL